MSSAPFLIVGTLSVVVAATVLGLYGYLVYAKTRYARASRFVAERLETAEYGLQRSVESAGSIADLAALARKYPLWRSLIQEFCAKRIRLGGTREEIERIRSLVRASFAENYRSRLTGRRWSDRVNAMISARQIDPAEYPDDL
ncbi:hypothetical protein EMG79_06860, partial [Klebsiella pneumoniae]